MNGLYSRLYIPTISPGLIYFRKQFLTGLYKGGLYTGGGAYIREGGLIYGRGGLYSGGGGLIFGRLIFGMR